MPWNPGHLYYFHFTLRAVFDAARLQDGKLVILAGAVNTLWIHRLIMESAKKMLRCDSVYVHDMIAGYPLRNFPEDSHKGGVLLFSELREQDDPQHSAELAARYLNAGGTVLAVVHGASIEGVQRRLLSLGISEKLINEKLMVMDCMVDRA